ncbi:MAG: YlxR family protein [Microcoleaceae cyanobacterium MO_207.B10]|nr:YlxR family protein [Microcoleaceae cyanobacterium MO_207.B10]
MKPNYRRCVSCKKLASKEDFWRVVRLSKSSTVKLDEGEGRAAYICPQPDCLKIAHKKNKLGRSLKAYISPEIYQSLWERFN